MEHREPPRIATAEQRSPDAGDDPVRSRRFVRFVTPPSVRRLSRTRIVLALAAGAALLYILPMAGLYGLRSLRTFVHEQPEYQLAFADIELDPAPPAWYRGGADRLLERVRKESGARERFSVLDLDLEQLKQAFQRDGLVRKVEVKVEHPNRVVVQLNYCEPVAYAWVKANGRHTRVVLDRDAVIVALDDGSAQGEVDLEAAGLLYLSFGNLPHKDNPPPSDLRAGVTWKSASGPDNLPEVNPGVLAGTRLADQLRNAQAEARARTGKRPTGLEAVVLYKSFLWVQFDEDRLVMWDNLLEPESRGEASFSDKWRVLRDWAEHYQPPARKPDYFRFEGDGIVARYRS